MVARAVDPHCVTCRPDQPGRVRMDQVWAWSLAHPGQQALR